MIHIGIDYSMTSPAVCVIDVSGNVWFHYLTSVKKYVGEFGRNIKGWEYPAWTTPEDRFDKISTWVFRCILQHCDANFGLNSPMKVTIEGYSMGSKGKVFHIAENTGILKYKLWQKNIPYDTPAPTTIKKFATGKGNADKQKMHDHFHADTGFSVAEQLGCAETANPCSDVVDSYFIARYGMIEEQSS